MKDTPSDWPRISSSLYYRDAAKMIDWLCAAFAFEVRLKVVGDDGLIRHSELTYGEGVIMVSQESIGAASRFGVDLKSSTHRRRQYAVGDGLCRRCGGALRAGARRRGANHRRALGPRLR